MTEQEAEAALLSLATPLVWARTPDSVIKSMSHTTSQWDAVGDGLLYRVYCFSEGADQQRPFRADRWEPDVELSGRNFPSLDAAKRACERHSVSGQWD